MRSMKNCLVRKLYGFKAGKIWRVNFSCVSRGFEISKVIFFVTNRENFKNFQVKKYQATLILNDQGVISRSEADLGWLRPRAQKKNWGPPKH